MVEDWEETTTGMGHPLVEDVVLLSSKNPEEPNPMQKPGQLNPN